MDNAGAYDVLIIGGGQAGIPLAYKLAAEGMRVALAERENLGGSCVNFGCTPTKAVIASARVAQQARRAAEFGLEIPNVGVNFPAVLQRARRIAEGKRSGLDEGLEGSENPGLIRGHARFLGREDGGFRLVVGEREVVARQVVLNTGTRTLIPPVDGLEGVDFIDSGNWLDRAELPEHLAIIGGGYIGLEMAQFYRRMGSRVTVVVGGSEHVVDHEDDDVADEMRSILEDEGVGFVFCARVERAAKDGGGGDVVLGLSGADPAELRASHLFVATGRRPNTDDLGLENIGLKVSERGIVETDERLATGVEGIWAAGDIRGGPMFTHTAWDDHRVLFSQMAGDGSRTTRRVVPYAIYTDPELGRAGMTEKEAREAGYEVEVMRYDMKREKGKALEMGENEGLIKVVANASDGRILGAAVLAAGGSELVHVYLDLMNAGAPYAVIRDAVHVHPTIAEDVQSVVS